MSIVGTSTSFRPDSCHSPFARGARRHGGPGAPKFHAPRPSRPPRRGQSAAALAVLAVSWALNSGFETEGPTPTIESTLPARTVPAGDQRSPATHQPAYLPCTADDSLGMRIEIDRDRIQGNISACEWHIAPAEDGFTDDSLAEHESTPSAPAPWFLRTRGGRLPPEHSTRRRVRAYSTHRLTVRSGSRREQGVPRQRAPRHRLPRSRVPSWALGTARPVGPVACPIWLPDHGIEPAFSAAGTLALRQRRESEDGVTGPTRTRCS